jgi:hypothetical protein
MTEKSFSEHLEKIFLAASFMYCYSAKGFVYSVAQHFQKHAKLGVFTQ